MGHTVVKDLFEKSMQTV